MIDMFITYAPVAGLIMFFIIFLGIAAWALYPANKNRFHGYSEIPLHEDFYGNQ